MVCYSSHHYTCDIIIDKQMEEYPKLAVNSKNIHITRRGFSPKQLMFGKQGVVPVIMDGNPASIEPVTENDGFRRGLMNGHRAEELYKNVEFKMLRID